MTSLYAFLLIASAPGATHGDAASANRATRSTVQSSNPNELVFHGATWAEVQADYAGYVDHAGEFDVSVAEFVERPHTSNRIALRPDGTTTQVGACVARFKIIDSLDHNPGETLDVVWLEAPVADPSVAPRIQPPTGQRYLLITMPQSAGDLKETAALTDSKKKLKLIRSVPAASPAEEMACTFLMTDAARVEGGPSPAERLIHSVADCLRLPDHVNRKEAYELLRDAGYPVPPSDLHRGVYAKRPSETIVTLAMRKEAMAGAPDVGVTELQVLTGWRFHDTGEQTLKLLAECAKDANAYIPHIGEDGIWAPKTGSILGATSCADFEAAALDGAVCRDVIWELLNQLQGAKLTMDQDKKLAVWLDYPKAEIRFFAARHLAFSRSRPDLSPSVPDVNHPRTVPGRTASPDDAYLDLDEKVAAWKQFFENH